MVNPLSRVRRKGFSAYRTLTGSFVISSFSGGALGMLSGSIKLFLGECLVRKVKSFGLLFVEVKFQFTCLCVLHVFQFDSVHVGKCTF